MYFFFFKFIFGNFKGKGPNTTEAKATLYELQDRMA